jgi:predicted HicB family RNase H-like nuclease
MALSEARIRANRKYNEKAYDRIALNVKKGKRDELSQIAKENGESLNEYIKTAIQRRYLTDDNGEIDL